MQILTVSGLARATLQERIVARRVRSAEIGTGIGTGTGVALKMIQWIHAQIAKEQVVVEHLRVLNQARVVYERFENQSRLLKNINSYLLKKL